MFDIILTACVFIEVFYTPSYRKATNFLRWSKSNVYWHARSTKCLGRLQGTMIWHWRVYIWLYICPIRASTSTIKMIYNSRVWKPRKPKHIKQLQCHATKRIINHETKSSDLTHSSTMHDWNYDIYMYYF